MGESIRHLLSFLIFLSLSITFDVESFLTSHPDIGDIVLPIIEKIDLI